MSNELKISSWSAKMLKQLPDKYRIIMRKILDYEVRDAVRLAADTLDQAWMVVLIEEGVCGTGKRATRLHRYHGHVQELVDTTADYYEDGVAIALRHRLHNLGVDFES